MLNNNSPEMGTIVETFIIEETAPLIYDGDQLKRWGVLVDRLELQGQNSIKAAEKSPIPFMHIKTSMKNVFEVLCPKKVDVKDYDVTPIPLEILDLIGLSINEDYFSHIQIWYDDKNPDPLCIGVLSEYQLLKASVWTSHDDKTRFKTETLSKEYIKSAGLTDVRIQEMSGSSKYYLLGKWADVKHSFEELKEMAIKRYIATQGNYYRKQIKEHQRSLDDLEIDAFDKFN